MVFTVDLLFNLHADKAHLRWTESTHYKTREWQTKRQRVTPVKKSRGLPPTAADSTHGLTLHKVRIDTKGTSAIWARRLRYIHRQKGLIQAAQPSQGHLLLQRVSGRKDPLHLQDPLRSQKSYNQHNVSLAKEIWMEMIHITTFGDTIEVMTEAGVCVSILYWEWEHVWCVFLSYNSERRATVTTAGERWRVCMQASTHTARKAQMHAQNNSHSSHSGKWNKDPERESL